ncbi:MAG: hypothetical protein WA432_05215 [Candidatus Babeliaceae bacterium]
MTTVFGTDGIRERVGTALLTHDQLISIGQALALWIQARSQKNPHILLIYDTRISNSYIKSTLKSGLLMHEVTLFDGGVLPTPAALHIMQQVTEFDCALIISASHNPYYDNGIKIFDKMGKLSEEDEQHITALINEKKTFTYSTFGQEINYHAQAEKIYSDQVIRFFPKNFLQHKKIVLDAAHGATYRCAEMIFEKLGAQVIMINNQPTGTNINDECGTLAPTALQKAVQDYQADVGFAFDGDGDRVIAVSAEGIIKDGDDFLALLLEHPAYRTEKIIVGTVMSNVALEQYLYQKNKQLVRTSVGDKYITEKLQQHNLLLGGEQSGHIILHDLLATGDGILSALRLLETLTYSHNWNLITFTKYPQILLNIPIKHKKDLAHQPYASLIYQAQKRLLGGRLLVRYSGTEPLLRIMVEAQHKELAQAVCTDIAHHLQTLLEQS